MATQDTIGNWPPEQLQKVIREAVAQLTPTNIPALTVDDLIVRGTTTLVGAVTYSSKAAFFTIGSTVQIQFLNGWVRSGTPYQDPSYIKTEDGMVRARGSAKSGTIALPLAQFPPGFRPANTVAFPAAGSGVVGIIEVDKNGNITPLAPLTNTRVSLDAIQFKAS
jgi:hypothetical protein